MDQSLSAFLIGAGIGAYGFLCGNKAFHDELESEKEKRHNLLVESQEGKFSLEKRLKAKEEEILSLTETLNAEQAKLQKYVAEYKNLEKSLAQKSDEIVELKMFSKDLKTALALSNSKEKTQDAEIVRLTAELKAEEEKNAALQAEITSAAKGKSHGDGVKVKGGKVAVTATVPEAAPAVTGAVKAEGEGRRKSFLGSFLGLF